MQKKMLPQMLPSSLASDRSFSASRVWYDRVAVGAPKEFHTAERSSGLCGG